MSFFGSLINVVAPGAGDDFDNAVNDVGNFVNDKIIEPIKQDPLRFVVVATAYAYGIPGLEFAGAGTAAATGIAAGTYSLAQGKNFDEAVKDGLKTAAFTAAGNYVKQEFFAGTPTLSTDAAGQPTGPVSLDSNVDGSGFDSGGFEVDGSTSGGFEPINAPVAGPTEFSGTDLPPASNAASNAVGPPRPSGLEMPGFQDTRFPTEQVPVNNPVQPGGPQMNTGQTGSSIYRSEFVPDERYGLSPESNMNPDYVPGSGKMSAEGTPASSGPDPNYPNSPNMRVNTPASADFKPEVVDYSRVATPDTTSLSFSNVGDAALAAGEYAYAHPYYTLGGLAVLSSLNKDKPQNDGSGGNDPNKQVGDPRFYQPMEQFQMIQNYDPYKDDIYRYGQEGGEHQFLTSPVYAPVQYADGGQVGMPPVDPMQQQYASPAVGPMMAPQQMPPQQPMGALSQANAAGYKPSPLTPRTGRPPVPQQMQGRGAPQQVPPQQQNPDYRYFSYGQIPASVSMPMQQPQGRATGGLAMARGGNVPDGRTDNIPALLSQGEYVMDAETVALLGNGNNDAGAKRLDHMREAVRKQKGGALARGKISPDAQSPLAYLSRRMA